MFAIRCIGAWAAQEGPPWVSYPLGRFVRSWPMLISLRWPVGARRTVRCGVRRAYTFRLRPTARQHVALGRCLASHRELYNAGQTPGYPRFKPAHRFDSVAWPKDGDGCRWQPDRNKVYLQGIGHLRVTVHRQVQGRIKTIQVRRQGRRWLLVLSCDQVPTRPLEPTGAAVGVDLGIASFATTSDGEHVPNPGYGRVAAIRLGTAQQALARKQRGSNNRRRARATVAARHRKLADQRRNSHHHLARALVSCYGLLVVEDLKIRNMLRRPRPRPDPDHPGRFLPNRAVAKTGLHRSIHDAGWAQFVSILRAKAEEAGRVVIVVDARHTSDRCEACGHTARENRVSQAVFSCRGCGHTLNADEHAARNILRAGLARLAAPAA
jgi:putative transposase